VSTQSPGQQLIDIVRSIGRGFAQMLSFRGRDSNAQFWPYALAVIVIVAFGTAIALDAPMRAASQTMIGYLVAHPGQGSVQVGANGASVTIHGFPPELTTVLWPTFLPIVGALLAAMALLAAAVIRRLRDGKRAIFWAGPPVLFAAVASYLFPTFFGPEPPNVGVFFILFANNVLYLIFLIRLIVLLAGPSVAPPEPGP
jgi:uncharacterized membrane protein YhaH (DUF805 family)